MRKLLLIFPFLLGIHTLQAQTTYYKYNNAGVPERVGYSTPSPNTSFSDYVPKIDPGQYERTQEMYVRAGMEKQRHYEQYTKSLNEIVTLAYEGVQKLPEGRYKIASLNLLKALINVMKEPEYDFSKYDVYIYWWNEINNFYKGL